MEMESSQGRFAMNGDSNKNKKIPGVMIGITWLCLIAYIVISMRDEIFSAGTFFCMFIIGAVQVFLHITFRYAIEKEAFGMVAGFDSKTAYHVPELKKLLAQLDFSIAGTLSTVVVAIFFLINCFRTELSWLNGLLMVCYVFNVIFGILTNNYRAIDKI